MELLERIPRVKPVSLDGGEWYHRSLFSKTQGVFFKKVLIFPNLLQGGGAVEGAVCSLPTQDGH